MTNSSLFIITGGPGSGKTTVFDELQRRGYHCVPEVARQIIQEQVQSGGDALPWGNQQRYTELMLQRSIDTFLPDGMAFADRGIPDTFAYARLIDLPNQTAIVIRPPSSTRANNIVMRRRYSLLRRGKKSMSLIGSASRIFRRRFELTSICCASTKSASTRYWSFHGRRT